MTFNDNFYTTYSKSYNDIMPYLLEKVKLRQLSLARH